jgi:hypothetical protein
MAIISTTKVPEEYVARLVKVLERASPDQRARGVGWYSEAHRWSAGLADEYRLTIEQAVGILAALSQVTRWETNKEYARRLCQDGEFARLGGIACTAMKRKALRILGGEHPLAVLRGLKVLNFYSNVLAGGGDMHVTIDRHCLTALHGHPTRTTPSPREYRTFADAYRVAGARVGLEVSQAQAVVWLVIREGNTHRARRSSKRHAGHAAPAPSTT